MTMQFSRMLARRAGRFVIVAAGSVAIAGLAACGGGGGGEGPLLYGQIKVASITQQGSCESVGVKLQPVNILPDPPKMSNRNEFVTSVNLAVQPDNVTCLGEAMTIPMAPGTWKFTVMLPSEIASCEREIKAGGNLVINFKDGDTSCT
ncbi:MAG: hypothetical protein ACK52I_31955 [Pseudomonadota bacterium]